MFAAMKTGTRVLAGFGLALAVAVAVGAIGYQGIHKLSTHVDDFGAVRLPGVQALSAIEAGQLDVGYGIRGLLIPRYGDPQTRAQQYELITSGFKQAEQGLAKYAALPKSPEEAAAWQDLQAVWSGWTKSLETLKTFCQQKDQLLAGGAKRDDPKITAVEDQTFENAKETRALMLKALEEVQHLNALNSACAEKSLAQAAGDATWCLTLTFTMIALSAVALLATGFVIARSISRVLGTLVNEATRLSQAALEGRLRTRANPELVSAEFRPIIEGVNAALDTIVKHIDSIPNPAMIIDKDFTVQFMNKVGSDLIGLPNEQIVGSKCYNQFKTSHCHTANCACAIAMQEGRKAMAETDAHPGNHNLQISYIAVPVKDKTGSVIGALEIVADQTALKTAETVMRKQAAFQEKEVRKLVDNLEKIAKGAFDIDSSVATADNDTREIGQKFHEINRSLTQACKMINSLITDANALSKAAVDGELGSRADDSKYEGEYRAIIHGMNQTLEGFNRPLQDIGHILQRMANKDFSKSIAAEYPAPTGSCGTTSTRWSRICGARWWR